MLRRDPTSGRWVVFRDQPGAPLPGHGRCPFCEGNEDLTPPEIVAWGRPGESPNRPGWRVRVVPSAEPLLRVELPLERRADAIYDFASGTGAHEIVIETPEHRASLAELPLDQVQRVLQAYAQRMSDLKGDRRLRSIFIFKNQGAKAGARMPEHSHAQVIGLPVTPKVLKEILKEAHGYYQLHERCAFCDIVSEELERDVRLVATTPGFVAIAPYAARVPFETWILPRGHEPDFEAAEPAVLGDLAGLLIALLARLERVLPEPAYNLFLYSGPNRRAEPGRWRTLAQDFHWHIQILPRVAQPAGFELGSGFYANSITPEQAAAALRLETSP